MAEAELKLPGYFPQAPKQCEKPAEAFFECFSTKGEQKEGVADPNAGRRALTECASLLTAYETCMTRYIKRNPPAPYYRVPEEYRQGGSEAAR
ncbi:hypothetical protein M885DRAFT_520845 [Pelagophyceae sp. CCMP2097]|nr:hypothetical protein M885DRAFT_520845 [Pelagophyceae sp. CCMP2097]|mmetsp:Transcript_18100/g.62221  ORF Transcript_18100/g.62221 Transcript_18100/m.62221 type:complete len:93 (-) Transcript_18100:812-1090(-)